MLTPIQWYGQYWGMLTRDFCQWLVNSETSHLHRRAMRHVKIPDEFFFQTLIKAGPFAETLHPSSRRYVKFEGLSPHPKTLTCDDVDEVLLSKAFFARKFDANVDESILQHFAKLVGANGASTQAELGKKFAL
jgi:hypothetical protein